MWHWAATLIIRLPPTFLVPSSKHLRTCAPALPQVSAHCSCFTAPYLPAVTTTCLSGYRSSTAFTSTHYIAFPVIATFTASTATTSPHILSPAQHYGHPLVATKARQMARLAPPPPPMASRHAPRRRRQPHLPSRRDLQTAGRGTPVLPRDVSLLGLQRSRDSVVSHLACLCYVAFLAYGMLMYTLVCCLVGDTC